MNKPAISIIVPVYNTEKYLGRCIDSILSQTTSNFELILVDDGSTDHSGIICDNYAQLDDRIFVFHQQNKGVSCARNAGIEYVKSEFITFCDSDDELLPEYLSTMIDISAKYDLVVTSSVHVNQFGQSKWEVRFEEKQINKVDHDIINSSFREKWIDLVICKRFKTEIIRKNRLLFNRGIDFSEDTLFSVEYIKYCKQIYICDKVLYKIFNNGVDSLSSFKTSSFERLCKGNRAIVLALETRYKKFRETDVYHKRIWDCCYTYIFQTLQSDLSSGTKYKMLRTIFTSEEYLTVIPYIDSFALTDSKYLQCLLHIRSPFLIMVFWKIAEIKRNLVNITMSKRRS